MIVKSYFRSMGKKFSKMTVMSVKSYLDQWNYNFFNNVCKDHNKSKLSYLGKKVFKNDCNERKILL